MLQCLHRSTDPEVGGGRGAPARELLKLGHSDLDTPGKDADGWTPAIVCKISSHLSCTVVPGPSLMMRYRPLLPHPPA